MKSYDIVTVGGGLGGSALARSMAERGARVLVVERETQFKDRVRGEALAPWGAVDAERLGILPLLERSGGRWLPWWIMWIGGVEAYRRDLRTTTPQRRGWLTYYHPRMQELLIDAAHAAGAEVRRGARVRAVTPGAPARVTVEEAGRSEEVATRLVVGADGRASKVRQWARFGARQDPPRLLFCGVLLDGLEVDADTCHQFAPAQFSRIGFLFPQGAGRVRAYFGFHRDTGLERLQAAGDVDKFLDHAEAIGFPPAPLRAARAAGPLASFEGADSWVDHPYREGVALVGDAAATSDPTWGQGMSLTLRDVRVLRDCLLADSDWEKAGHAYAERHDWHYGVQHQVDGWFADIFMEPGPEADGRRAQALPRLALDPLRIADCPHSGPEAPHDDAVRQRFFGLE
jgi:2-polyprenyl-6-methoxyphenol hydroxylase-like FAD-dependent oxidoreductase